MNNYIDVVIPLHNDKKFIGLAIQSVLSQTLAVNKLFIVNDRSTDGSVDVVNAYREVDSRVVLLENSGFERSAARNTGIKASTAEYIAFLDSDDFWHPEKIERQISLIKEKPINELVYSNYLMIDEFGQYQSNSVVLAAYLRGSIFKELLLENKISGSASAVLCKRSLFEKVGYFDESLRYGEDWDMWLRLARVTNFDYVDGDMVYIRARTLRASRDNYFQRNYKRSQHIVVWSKWPKEARKNPEIISRLAGYFRYPHIRVNLSINEKLKRVEVHKRRFAKSLHPSIWHSASFTLYYLLLNDYVMRLIAVFKHRVYRIIFLLTLKPSVLIEKIQNHLAKKLIKKL